MIEVTIHWCAFRTTKGATQATIKGQFLQGWSDSSLLEMVFEETNLYRGPIWNALYEVLPPNRSHTALCVDDEVTIRREYTDEYGRWKDERTYACDNLGWKLRSSSLEPSIVIAENLNGPLTRR